MNYNEYHGLKYLSPERAVEIIKKYSKNKSFLKEFEETKLKVEPVRKKVEFEGLEDKTIRLITSFSKEINEINSKTKNYKSLVGEMIAQTGVIYEANGTKIGDIELLTLKSYKTILTYGQRYKPIKINPFKIRTLFIDPVENNPEFYKKTLLREDYTRGFLGFGWKLKNFDEVIQTRYLLQENIENKIDISFGERTHYQ